MISPYSSVIWDPSPGAVAALKETLFVVKQLSNINWHGSTMHDWVLCQGENSIMPQIHSYPWRCTRPTDTNGYIWHAEGVWTAVRISVVLTRGWIIFLGAPNVKASLHVRSFEGHLNTSAMRPCETCQFYRCALLQDLWRQEHIL